MINSRLTLIVLGSFIACVVTMAPVVGIFSDKRNASRDHLIGEKDSIKSRLRVVPQNIFHLIISNTTIK